MQWLTDINQCNSDLWKDQDYPFIGQPFLEALQNSHSVGGRTGWQPHYLCSDLADSPSWLIPAFVKEHSYGEYVFDWSWANAYEQHGLDYYPKLLIAAPFTPATGKRSLGLAPSEWLNRLPEIEQHCLDQNYSSAHILFPSPEEQATLKTSHWLQRIGVQFHWFNRNYTHFDDFLSFFKSRKRKAVKKERQQLKQQGILIQQLSGENISDEDWAFFYQCYQTTYYKRGMQGYLNLSAFKQMSKTMGKHMLMITAKSQDKQPLACALYFLDKQSLYGRYWGCVADIPGLHFELCYYQGIEYCIKHKLTRFDPGTQGEHKISRGFEPTFTYSYHWIAHPDFRKAVARFVEEEAEHTKLYKQDCDQHLPFNDEAKHTFTE